MDKIFKGWKNYIIKSESLLREVQEVELREIEKYVKGLPAEVLSFNNIFKGANEKRILFPFNGDGNISSNINASDLTVRDGGMSIMRAIFAFAEATPNFADSTVSQQVKSDKSDKVQIRKTRIGKWLNKIVSLREKIDGEYYATGLTKTEEERRTSLQNRFKRDFGEKTASVSINVIKKAAEFWKSKADFYRKNPQVAFESKNKYSIIVSRAPIDILRMSDFQNIQSCHSPKQGYFKCAQAEAMGNGLVSFVIETEQWDKLKEKFDLDLQDDEIFSDNEREKSGLVPISRLRLRKFTYKNPLDGEEKELAVPESRTYGKRIPGLRESITEWAYDSQPEVRKMASAGKYPDFSSFVRYGGSYSDSSDGKLLNLLFDSKIYQDYDDVEHDTEDEGGIDELPGFIAALQDIEEAGSRMLVNGAFATFEANDEGDGPYAMMDGGIVITLDSDKFLHHMYGSSYAIQDSIAPYIDLKVSGVYFEGGKRDNTIAVTISVSSEDYFGVDGFQDFVNDVDAHLDHKAEEIEEILKEVLMSEGIYESNISNSFRQWANEITSGEVKYEHFDAAGYDESIHLNQIAGHEKIINVTDFINQISHFMLNHNDDNDKLDTQYKKERARMAVISAARRSTLLIEKSLIEFVNTQITAQLSLPGIDTASAAVNITRSLYFDIKTEYVTTSYRDNGAEIKIILSFNLPSVEDEVEVLATKTFARWIDKKYDEMNDYIAKEMLESIRVELREYISAKGGAKGAFSALEEDIKKVSRLVQETGKFQEYAKTQNYKAKKALISKGGNNFKAKPYVMRVSLKRSKSAPPE